MEINNLASALCKAQSEMEAAHEGGYNPHFKSNFCRLTDLINASRPALTAHGLSVSQYPNSDADATYLVTVLMHSSGEKIVSQVKMVLDKPSDIQSFGKVMTYLKRYAYAAIVGIAIADDEDDDGNSISVRTDVSRAENNPQVGNPYQNVTPSAPTGSNCISEKQYGMLKAILKGNEELEAKICAHYKIESLAQLPWKHMQEVVNKLKPKE